MPRSPSYVVRGYQGDREKAARLLWQTGPYATLTAAKKAAQPQADAAKRGVKVYVEPVGTEEVETTYPRDNPDDGRADTEDTEIAQALLTSPAPSRRPNPALSLPDDPWRYFKSAPGAVLLPVAKLVPVRARPTGIENAAIYMRRAYDGTMEKRKPLSVAPRGDGTYTVCDGNSTFANAQRSGWVNIVAIIGERCEAEPAHNPADPVERPRMRPTFHQDGTVSYYSYAWGQWDRQPLGMLTDIDIEDMPEEFQAKARELRAGSKGHLRVSIAPNPRASKTDILASVRWGLPPALLGRVYLSRGPRGVVLVASANLRPYEVDDLLGSLRRHAENEGVTWTVEPGIGDRDGVPVVAIVRPVLSSSVPLDNPATTGRYFVTVYTKEGAHHRRIDGASYEEAKRLKGEWERRGYGVRVEAELAPNPSVSIHSDISEASYPAIFGKTARGIPEADDPFGHNECDDEQACGDQIEETRLSDTMRTVLRTRAAYLPRMQHVMAMLRRLAPGATVLGRVKTPYSLLQKLVKAFVAQPDARTGEGRFKVAGGTSTADAPLGVPLQLKDMAGTKIVARDRAELDQVRDAMLAAFRGHILEYEDKYAEEARPGARRVGYVAYHMVVLDQGLPVEIIMQTLRIEALGHASHTPYKEGRLNLPVYIEMVDLVNAADQGDRAAAAKIDPLLVTKEGQHDLEHRITLAQANPGVRWRNPTEPDVIAEVTDRDGWAA